MVHLGSIVIAFAAGWGAHVQLTTARPPQASTSNDSQRSTAVLESQVATLTRAHHARLQDLTKRYEDEQAEVASFGNIDQAHQWHAEAARGYADQIKEENESFHPQIEALRQLQSAPR